LPDYVMVDDEKNWNNASPDFSDAA
jgi:hypothetical protein